MAVPAYSLSAIALASSWAWRPARARGLLPAPLSVRRRGVGRAERRARVSHALAPDRCSLPNDAGVHSAVDACAEPSGNPAAGPSTLRCRAVRWQNPMCPRAPLLRFDDAQHGGLLAGLRSIGRPCAVPSPRAAGSPTSLSAPEIDPCLPAEDGTMSLSWPGADAHGWRNSLNYYGWAASTRRLRRPVVHLVRRRAERPSRHRAVSKAVGS